MAQVMKGPTNCFVFETHFLIKVAIYESETNNLCFKTGVLNDSREVQYAQSYVVCSSSCT